MRSEPQAAHSAHPHNDVLDWELGLAIYREAQGRKSHADSKIICLPVSALISVSWGVHSRLIHYKAHFYLLAVSILQDPTYNILDNVRCLPFWLIASDEI